MFLLDTNIIIYHLDGLLPPIVQERVNNFLVEPLPLSIITKIELLGFRFNTPQQKASTALFLQTALWLTLTDAIADEAISLRQSYKLKTPDAIIASTAIVHGLTLVSRNDKDFGKIPTLRYFNPFG